MSVDTGPRVDPRAAQFKAALAAQEVNGLAKETDSSPRETRSVAEMIDAANGNAAILIKDLVPFVTPNATELVRDQGEGRARVRLGKTAKLAVNLTEPENPQVSLWLRNPNKDKTDSKAYQQVDLVNFSVELSQESDSITVTPPFEQTTQFPPLVVSAEGVNRLEMFQSGSRVAEQMDEARDAADLLRRIVPLGVLAKGRSLQGSEDHLEIKFGTPPTRAKEGDDTGKITAGRETTMILNLRPEDGSPRGIIVVEDKNGTEKYTLDNRTIRRDTHDQANAVLFDPSQTDRDERHAHQIRLTGEGVKQLLRNDEARFADLQLPYVRPQFLEKLSPRDFQVADGALHLAGADDLDGVTTGSYEYKKPTTSANMTGSRVDLIHR